MAVYTLRRAEGGMRTLSLSMLVDGVDRKIVTRPAVGRDALKHEAEAMAQTAQVIRRGGGLALSQANEPKRASKEQR